MRMRGGSVAGERRAKTPGGTVSITPYFSIGTLKLLQTSNLRRRAAARGAAADEARVLHAVLHVDYRSLVKYLIESSRVYL